MVSAHDLQIQGRGLVTTYRIYLGLPSLLVFLRYPPEVDGAPPRISQNTCMLNSVIRLSHGGTRVD